MLRSTQSPRVRQFLDAVIRLGLEYGMTIDIDEDQEDLVVTSATCAEDFFMLDGAFDQTPEGAPYEAERLRAKEDAYFENQVMLAVEAKGL